MADGRKPKALSLDTFAKVKGNIYDKRAKLEKETLQKLNKKAKYKKIAKRFGPKAEPQFKDNVADLEHELFLGQVSDGHPSEQPTRKRQKREAHARQADETNDENQAKDQATAEQATEINRQADTANVEHPIPKQEGHAKEDANNRSAQGRSHQHQTSDSQPAAIQQQQQHKGKWQENDGPDCKKRSRLHRLMEEQRQQKAAVEEARRQAQKAREERQAQIQAAQKRRKDEKRQFYKRTRTGQPLMRYRMEKMLSVIQREIAQG